MATPAELEALSAQLRASYAAAHEAIMAEQERIADDPKRYTRRARLKELQRAVDERLDQVDEQARAWLADDFPQIYRAGASSAAGILDAAFTWTTIDADAVAALATDTFAELLAATDGVSDSTKSLIRTLGKEQSLLKEAAGKTAVQAGRDLRRLLESKGIHAVRYADGSRHGIAEYADMLLRTVTARAHNAGTLNFAKRAGTTYVECFDGFDCGLTSHTDPEKANGMILTVERAAQYAIAHPRCRRAFGPRPDVTSAEQAKNAQPSTTEDQREDQAASERAQAARGPERRQRQTTAERAAAKRRASADARAARQATRAERAGVQGDLGIDDLPPLPRPADLPANPGGLSADQLANARRGLPKLKATVRANAGEVRDEARFALDTADVFQMAPPYARDSAQARSTGLYDWFYGLHPDEQARLRSGWMKGHRQTANPDQIAERIANFYGGADFDTSMARWVDETRRYDAAGALSRGKLPQSSRYGGQFDLDGIFGDGTFKVRDLFDADVDHAVRSVAETHRAQSEGFASRAFARSTGDRPQPYQMSQADYVDELTTLEARAANIRPLRSDPEFGDEYAAADVDVLRRLDELVPRGVEGAESLPADVLHQKVMELAGEAGLI